MERGMVSTLAGSKAGNQDGWGAECKLNGPQGIILNPFDNCLYFCDSQNCIIRKSTMEGDVSTFATSIKLKSPHGLTMYYKEKCFFVTNRISNTVCKISPTGGVALFAGSERPGYDDGEGEEAKFNWPSAITVDQRTGNIYVSDDKNHSIRKINPRGRVTTIAGSSKVGHTDGVGISAQFNWPWGLHFNEEDQSLLVGDYGNNAIRKVFVNTGVVITLCEVRAPAFVEKTENGIILVTSHLKNSISKVTLKDDGEYDVQILAGTGQTGGTDGVTSRCTFSCPHGIALDENSYSCYVTDFGNSRIRKISFME